jgi:hypothetical protein
MAVVRLALICEGVVVCKYISVNQIHVCEDVIVMKYCVVARLSEGDGRGEVQPVG